MLNQTIGLLKWAADALKLTPYQRYATQLLSLNEISKNSTANQTEKPQENGTHNATHNATEGWNCGKCGKTFKRKDHMKRHEKTHLEEREKLICVCDARCISMQAFNKHWYRKHKNVEYQMPTKETVNSSNTNKTFICEYCGKFSIRKENLANHMATHGFKEKPSNECEFCHKMFSNASNLKVHKIGNHNAEISTSAALKNEVCTK